MASRTRPYPFYHQLKKRFPTCDLIKAGSAGFKGALVAQGKADTFINPVNAMHEWDTCAAALLVAEAGGRVSDCRGLPLFYNQPPFIHRYGIVMTNPTLFDQLIPISIQFFS